MSPRVRFLCPWICVIATLWPQAGLVRAEEAKPEWEVRILRVPVGISWNQQWQLPPGEGNPTRPDQPAKTPALPTAGAAPGKWEEHLRESSKTISQWCADQGFAPIEGTLFLHDDASGTLAVRASTEWLDAFAQYLENTGAIPKGVGISLEILQADAVTVRAMVKETMGRGDHSTVLKRLQELVAQGKASVVRQLKGETRSSQRKRIREGADMAIESGMKMDDSGRIELVQESQWVGTFLEVEPVIGPDGKLIDAHCSFEHHYAPAAQRKVFVGQAGKLGAIEAPVTDLRLARVTTSFSFQSGMVRLLGAWTPEGTAEFAKGDVMQAAFLRLEVVPALPAERKALADMLTRHGARVSPSPPQRMAPAIPRVPPGMERRRFKVPPDFLTAAGGGAPPSVTPFNPPAGVLIRPASRQVLEAHGIPFPDGANASFSAATSTLEVVNTPQNLQMIEALVAEIHVCGPRSLVSLTLEVVECEGRALRELAEEARTVADHGPQMKQLEELAAQGRAKFLRTARLDTLSGNRALVESGTIWMDVADVGFGPPKAKEAPATPREADKQRAEATKPAEAPAETPKMHVSLESRPTGTRLEVDPVIGPDGYTVDLNLAFEHHYAPPVARKADSGAADGKTFRVSIPGTDFHCATVTTANTTTKGMTKLLAVWRPQGAPQFEGKDVMQAAFLRMDLAKVEKEEEKPKDKMR